MTKAKAATVSAALVNADFVAQVFREGANNFSIRATNPDGAPVSVDAVKTFADNQSIIATVREVHLS